MPVRKASLSEVRVEGRRVLSRVEIPQLLNEVLRAIAPNMYVRKKNSCLDDDVRSSRPVRKRVLVFPEELER